MFNNRTYKIAPPIAQAIEDAVMFGNIKEIDGVLELVGDDVGFPAELRHGLEALRYFRAHYGKGGILEPVLPEDIQTVIKMESLWGRGLLEKLSETYVVGDDDASKYA